MTIQVRAWEGPEWLDCSRHAPRGVCEGAEDYWAVMAGPHRAGLFFCGAGAHYVRVYGQSQVACDDLLSFRFAYSSSVQ